MDVDVNRRALDVLEMMVGAPLRDSELARLTDESQQFNLVAALERSLGVCRLMAQASIDIRPILTFTHVDE